MMFQVKVKPISIKSVFKDGLNLYKKYFFVLIAVSSIGTVLPLFLKQFNIFEVYFFAGLVSFLFSATTIVYINSQVKKKRINLTQAINYMFGLFIPIVILSLLLLFIFFLGFLLLIIPGFWAIIVFSQSYYFVLLEKKSPIESLSLSRTLTKGNRVKILIIEIFLIPLGVLIGHIPNLVVWSTFYSIISSSFIIILDYSLWINLRKASSK